MCGITYAGEVPFTNAPDGAFSIFYRGCKQSNLSTHSLIRPLSCTKVMVFVQIFSIVPLFLMCRRHFNLL